METYEVSVEDKYPYPGLQIKINKPVTMPCSWIIRKRTVKGSLIYETDR